MACFAGTKPTLEEQLKQNKDTIKVAVRELDRSRMRLEMDQKMLQGQIKQAAARGDKDAARIHATTLVRTNANIRRFAKTKATLQALSLKMQTVAAINTMNQAISSSNDIMQSLSKDMDVKAMSRLLSNFSRENARLDMAAETMSGMLDDVLAEDNEEADVETEVSKVYALLGIEALMQDDPVPTGQLGYAQGQAVPGPSVRDPHGHA